MTENSTDIKPDFIITPVRPDEIGGANFETVRNLAQQAVPLLRELRHLNWKIELIDD